MAKRMRRSRCCISSCTSPRSAFLSPHFCYEEDVWMEIAKFLDGKSLVKLGVTNRWFHKLMMEDCVWKYACLRDLNVPEPQKVDFKWVKLYASAFDGSHSYCFRQPDKHIDWMRVGAFLFDSPVGLLTEHLSLPVKIPRERTTEEMVRKNGACILKNIKTGIWIADLQLVSCPVCNLDTCEGTMQTLDARHFDLFLREDFKNGTWNYEEIGDRKVQKQCTAATGAIFDVKYIKSSSVSQILDLKSWRGKLDDLQPKSQIDLHGVAVNTNLQQNEGLYLKYHTMKNAVDGEVVAIRISQQLI